MSVADLLGLPEPVQTTLLLLAIALMLASVLSGVKIGGIEIPRLDPRRRRALRVIGPVSVLVAIALVMPVRALQPPPTELRLLAGDAMDNGDIDVVVANAGTGTALLTAIELEVRGERVMVPRPVLQTSATYDLPLGDLSVGQRRRLVIRHLIAPGATERFSIHAGSTRAASVQMSLFAADGGVMRTTLDLTASTQSLTSENP